MEELIGKDFEENTLKGYRTCLLHLATFLKKKYKSDDLAINRLDYNFINDFNHYLKLEGGIQPFSAAKYLKHLKKVISSDIWVRKTKFETKNSLPVFHLEWEWYHHDTVYRYVSAYCYRNNFAPVFQYARSGKNGNGLQFF